MSSNIYIYKVRARLLLLISAAILLTACSDDTDKLPDGIVRTPDDTGKVVHEPDRPAAETDILRIVPYIQDLVSPPWPAATREITKPSGYNPYNGSASIGVFMTPSTTEMTLISYEDNAWHSLVKVTPGDDYYIYGYMPAYATCQITGEDYENGAVLTFTDVPPVMSEDFSVITGVLRVSSSNPDNATGSLVAGNFTYKGQASGENFVDLMFDHLYGALNISLTVDKDYNALRTIKLKELKLRTSANGSPTKSKTKVTVTLNKTPDGTSPISENGGIVFEPDDTSDDMGDVSFFLSATGEELDNNSYKSFMGHFMPKGITRFVLTSVYDVYDKKGNLVRKDCEAVNTLEISELYDRQMETDRGCKYNVKMTIMPTFLYVLSDPDLESPTVVVN